MLLLLVQPLWASPACATLYYDCTSCITHYADRQCGWNQSSSKCVDCNSTNCASFIYGPTATCTNPTLTPSPSPVPTIPPAPAPDFGSNCSLYPSCAECTVHTTDRNCGWCNSSRHCIAVNGSESCPQDKFYFGNNAKCGDPVPPPDPTPWPRYDPDATFCYAMTGQWCQKCVTANKSMNCGWCHGSQECVAGDAQGPWFQTAACGNWSFTETDLCLGRVSSGQILAIRIGVGIAIGIIIVVSLAGCYVIIRKPNATDRGGYAEISSLESRS
jgi:hypothetical protein